ncbi:hypothetical protein D3C74_50960 [compost metagenome]
MKAGDVVFFEGKGLIGRLIQKLTGSPYSHVALAVDSESIIEADRFIRTRITILPEENRVAVMRVSPELSEKETASLVLYAKTMIGRKYDYANIFTWFIRLVFQWNRFKLVDNANRLYCSELIDRAYQDALNIDLCPDRQEGDVTPSQLFTSNMLKLV